MAALRASDARAVLADRTYGGLLRVFVLCDGGATWTVRSMP
jgi:hypothetical protein